MEITRIPLFQRSFDDGRSALSRPPLRMPDGSPLPTRCALSFMRDALAQYVEEHGLEPVCVHESEVADFPVYVDCVNGVDVCLVQAPVGAPTAAILMDRLIDSGVTDFVSCGGCGVLERIDSGVIVVPTSALRDEGTSYHYAAPSPTIDVDECMVRSIVQALEEHNVPYLKGMTWSCDGFFRETPDCIRQRKAQGCMAVDMEVSALAAVARFYGARYGAVLYSGDSLQNPDEHDHRNWIFDFSSRSISLLISLDALSRI